MVPNSENVSIQVTMYRVQVCLNQKLGRWVSGNAINVSLNNLNVG